ncbi:MAG: nitroreductase family protein [Bacteroidota bacterium]
MNSFLNLAKSRYSVRNYLELPVEDEKLLYVLECGRIAPSAANFQPCHIVVIRDPEMRRCLASTYPRSFFLQAPVILVICGDHNNGWKRSDGKDHTDIDAAIIADHMTLAAAEQGLGTCWICNFDAGQCGEILNLPANMEPVIYLTLGYPGREPDDRARHLVRKSLEEIVHWEKL